MYGDADLRLVEQIRVLQDFGFGLEETRPFLDCLRAGHSSGDDCPASIEVYRAKLAELDALLDRLRDVRDQLGAQLLRAEAAQQRPTGPEPRCHLRG
ncbi:hypothetical protein GCM10009757_24960 [Streptomyces cheonanensis]|uniref:HTH merR-type domain-containing protein n=1 Tax=Streptomyces cheonanensis TaxID=312720 RepID=A0ABN2V4R2_9ACTN